MLGGSIALYRKINYRLFEQLGLPQSSHPCSKSGNKKFRSHTQNVITGKEILLYNTNERKQMKTKTSHIKLMDNLSLHVHPVIANTEPTSQPINNCSDITNTFLQPPKNIKINREIILKTLHIPPKSFACQDVNDMQRRK